MTSTSKPITKYLNTSRQNFQEWKRDVDKALATHPDKLLIVVQERELSKAILLKLKTQYKSLDETWDNTIEQDHSCFSI